MNKNVNQNFGNGTNVKSYKPVSQIFSEMNNAVDKYGESRVELLLDEEQEIFYVHYHDKHDSHPIGDVYSISDYDISDIKKLEDMCNEYNFDFEKF